MERDFLKGLGLDDDVISQILEENEREVQSVTDELADVRGALEQREYEDALQAAVRREGLKFSSKAAEREFFAALREKQLRLADGKIEGLDEFVQSWKAEDPDAFASDRSVPRFLAPAGVGGAQGAAPANVAQAREMGAQRAAARKASGDVMKNFL